MLTVNSATVILTNGTDKVIAHTDRPSPLPKISVGNLMFNFDAEKDTGVEYVRKVFGIEPKIIDDRKGYTN